MSYELRLAPQAQEAIREYVLEFGNPDSGELATAIQGELEKLIDNPFLGTTQPGPLPGLIYRFSFRAGGLRHHLQVIYRYTEDEKALEVMDFGVVPM